MATLYRIKAWNATFETSETRKLKSLNWLPEPVRRDGRAYRRLVRTDAGIIAWGCFKALLGVAATCEPRGELRRDTGEPLDLTDLSGMTGISETTLEKAMQIL